MDINIVDLTYLLKKNPYQMNKNQLNCTVHLKTYEQPSQNK